MSNQQLSKLDFLDRDAAIFRQSKKRLTENSKEIQEIITNNTKKEVENVQNAINALNQSRTNYEFWSYWTKKKTDDRGSKKWMSLFKLS